MITDIFSRRYAGVQMRDDFYKEDRIFMVQAVSLVKKALWTGPVTNKVPDEVDTKFKYVHDAVGQELGREFLVDRYWVHRTTWNGNTTSQTYTNNYVTICKNFLTLTCPDKHLADDHIKDRLSLVEQAFRHKWNTVSFQNRVLESNLETARKDDEKRAKIKGDYAPLLGALGNSRQEAVKNANRILNRDWESLVDELNVRLRQALYKLHFHNGYLQFTEDELTEDEIKKAFWSLVADAKWASVDQQMKEAIDARDRGDRAATLHAFSALESVVKIISGIKGWTTGTEKGAAHFVNNLQSKKNGKFIDDWEGDMLKSMFSGVRNPFAHGPGADPLAAFTTEQTTWAIDTSMPLRHQKDCSALDPAPKPA